MSDGKILLALEHPAAAAGGRPGVMLRGKDFWLTDDVHRGPTAMLDGYLPGAVGLADDHRLEGGLLPPGAVAATVTDDGGERRTAAIGSGAWAIVLERPYDGGPASPVCFRDTESRLLRRPQRPDWPRSPVMDAVEACPACDSAGVEGPPLWDEVRPIGTSRGAFGPHEEPIPYVACRTCGYEHSVGVWLTTFEEDPVPPDATRPVVDGEAARRRHARGPLSQLRHPAYAVLGRVARLGGWGQSDFVTTSVTVDHGPLDEAGESTLHVQTSSERDDFVHDVSYARSMLAGWLETQLGPVPERSPAALSIWWHIRSREVLRLATLAQIEERSILVDGEPTAFTVASFESRWTAAGRAGELRIAIWGAAVGIGSIELAALADPVRELIGD